MIKKSICAGFQPGAMIRNMDDPNFSAKGACYLQKEFYSSNLSSLTSLNSNFMEKVMIGSQLGKKLEDKSIIKEFDQ